MGSVTITSPAPGSIHTTPPLIEGTWATSGDISSGVIVSVGVGLGGSVYTGYLTVRDEHEEPTSGTWQIQVSQFKWDQLSDGNVSLQAYLSSTLVGDSTSSEIISIVKVSDLAKPTTPSPANGSGPGINFTNRTVSWVDGGGAETYTIRMDSGGTPYNVVSLSQAATSYTIPEADLALYQDNIISWRVDAEAGGETIQGDVWTFDPRPAKATTPVPANAAENQSLNLAAISWAASTYATSYTAYPSWYGGVSGITTAGTSITLADYTPVIMDRLEHGGTYTWRVDTVNQWGTTTGDEWSFDTLAFDPPVTSWTNLPGMTLGPLDGGVEGIDFYYTGVNFMAAVRRIVAAAADSIWYEDIGG